jgi:signal transduction histidine kinase
MEANTYQAPPWSKRTALLDSLLAAALTLMAWIQISVPPRLYEMRLPPRESVGPFVHVFLTNYPPSALAYLLVAACFAPLALRRRNPLPVLAFVGVMSALYSVLPLPPSLTQVAVLGALYTASSMVDRRRLAPWAIAIGVLTLLTGVPSLASRMFVPDLARTLALLIGAVALGDATRNRRAYVAEVEQRAVEAERMRDEEASRRVDEERLRIAREMHDITAHSLSVVAVQSGAALHVIDSDPEAARTALTAIRDTSKSALAELRGMFGVLRGDGEAGSPVPLAPTPGLARIEELVRPLRETGIDVTLDVDLGSEPLPALVDASAFRIVQEALTNVLRHAGNASVRVQVRRQGDQLSIEVADEGGVAQVATGEGHGIAGMRERATALGGTFGAGPAPNGGWWVFATLPISGRSSSA